MKKGIDVSAIQGEIDWGSAGIDFAMLKATQGRGETPATRGLLRFIDRRFRENVRAAADAGISLGCYHYFTARNEDEAVSEAEYFLRVIEPYRRELNLWAAVDAESERWLGDLDRETLTAAVGKFLECVGKSGFEAMLYTNPNYLKNRFSRTFDADIWLAHWNVAEPMRVPRLKIWQYGSEAVAGVGVCGGDIGYFEDEPESFAVGGSYTVRRGDIYSNGVPVPERLVGRKFTIGQVRDSRILLSEINSWIRV